MYTPNVVVVPCCAFLNTHKCKAIDADARACALTTCKFRLRLGPITMPNYADIVPSR